MTSREERFVDAVEEVLDDIRAKLRSMNPCELKTRLRRWEDRLQDALAEIGGNEVSDETLGGDLDMRDGSEGKDEEERKGEEPEWEREPR